jgi:hypothetical protein
VTYEVDRWPYLSPKFRTAHNRLRVARGQPPIPPPKVDLYVPPSGPKPKPTDPADKEPIDDLDFETFGHREQEEILLQFGERRLTAIERALGAPSPANELRSELARYVWRAKSERQLPSAGTHADLTKLKDKVDGLRETVLGLDDGAQLLVEIYGGWNSSKESAQLDFAAKLHRLSMALNRACADTKPSGRPAEVYRRALLSSLRGLEQCFPRGTKPALKLMLKTCEELITGEKSSDASLRQFIKRTKT